TIGATAIYRRIAGISNSTDLPATSHSGRRQFQGLAHPFQSYSQGLNGHRDIVQKHRIAVGSVAQAAARHGVRGIKFIAGSACGLLAQAQGALKAMIKENPAHTDTGRAGQPDVREFYPPIFHQVFKIQRGVAANVDSRSVKCALPGHFGGTHPHTFQMDALAIVVIRKLVCGHGQVSFDGDPALASYLRQRPVIKALEVCSGYHRIAAEAQGDRTQWQDSGKLTSHDASWLRGSVRKNQKVTLHDHVPLHFHRKAVGLLKAGVCWSWRATGRDFELYVRKPDNIWQAQLNHITVKE